MNEMLEKILIDHPEIEIVQIQFNYADYESSSVQSKDVYDEDQLEYGRPTNIWEEEIKKDVVITT